MSRKILIGSIICILGTLSAGAIGLCAYLYNNSYQASLALTIYTPFNRTFLVEAVDPQNRTLIVAMRLGVLNDARLQVSVPENTLIYRQDPIFENGVLTGFKQTEPAQFSDLAVGTRGYMALTPNFDTGNGISVTYILIGGPMPTP
jgi:hypothetical protein